MSNGDSTPRRAGAQELRSGDGSGRRPMVAPFARALALLAAFDSTCRWLGNRDLAMRTGIPPSTVTRFTQSLVVLGYLHHDPVARKFRLTPAVLALGYGAAGPSSVQYSVPVHMREFADEHKVHLSLSSRNRLDLIVTESCSGPVLPPHLQLHVGARLAIASCPMGWALLAALPESERDYLLSNVQQRTPREWPRLRRRSIQGIAQVYQNGFCTSLGEWDQDVGVVATPLVRQGHAPLVLACIGSNSRMSRARVDRELGPRLIAMAGAIRQEGLNA